MVFANLSKCVIHRSHKALAPLSNLQYVCEASTPCLKIAENWLLFTQQVQRENFQKQCASEMEELHKQVCLQRAYTAQLKAEVEALQKQRDALHPMSKLDDLDQVYCAAACDNQFA